MLNDILSLFINQDAYVVSFLVAGIMVTVILLLVFNFKSPESVVMNEVNSTSSENIEGALRRVLGEKSWVGAPASTDGDSSEALQRLAAMEKEVLTKDKEIADLHKQLTQGASQAAAGDGDNSDLMSQIDELEARLREYEIIEDDIADLSLYKTENEKLKQELEALKSGGADEPVAEPVAEEPVEVSEPEEVPEPVAEEPASAPEPPVAEPEPEPTEEDTGRDLVAEFEKVVNNKDAVFGDEDGIVVGDSDEPEADGEATVEASDNGEVVMAEAKEPEKKSESSVKVVSPKMKDIEPDSKEEAEILIADLKSLKKGS